MPVVVLKSHFGEGIRRFGVYMAALFFDTPSAYVTFVHRDRVFFKSNLSSRPANEVPRAHSFCSLAILQDKITILHDTFDNPELLDNPYVSGEAGIRFYVGAPLSAIKSRNDPYRASA